MNRSASEPVTERRFESPIRSLTRLQKSGVALLLLVHAGLLAWGSARQSPTPDEACSMVAGISHWRLARFDLYRVNPPLVRAVAVLPVVLRGVEVDWSGYDDSDYTRPEYEMGRRFIRDQGTAAFRLFAIARWAAVPFSLVGCFVCFLWGYRLYGPVSGFLAAGLWCFSPNVLGHGQLFTTDVPAAAMAGAATYAFWRWLQSPCWERVLLSGMLLGLAALTKTTCLLLIVVWPILWISFLISRHRDLCLSQKLTQIAMLLAVLVTALVVINCGYGLEGSFTKLGDYQFCSRVLAGPITEDNAAGTGNRFSDSLLADVPVPVPRNYLRGIDLQRTWFERHPEAFLGGVHRQRGWWYYYLYGLGVKIPVGTLVLLAGVCLLRCYCKPPLVHWTDELALVFPLLAFLLLVSSQTSNNYHVRYAFPLLTFLYVWTSQIAAQVSYRPHLRAGVVLALAWSIASSLWAYPHTLSYFNEIAGGPYQGYKHLNSSNIDWGQDYLFLRQWAERHPQARPLTFSWACRLLNPADLGLGDSRWPSSNRLGVDGSDSGPGFDRPQPGWYAIRAVQLDAPQFSYFQRSTPAAAIGYSIYIYHLSPQDAEQACRQMAISSGSQLKSVAPGNVAND